MSSEFKTFWQNPPLNPEDLIKHNFYEDQEELKRIIQDQYIQLNNLGIDFIQSNFVEDQTFHEMISYVSENYIPIVNIESILDSPIQNQIIGRFTYLFICVDIVTEILPGVMKYVHINDPHELIALHLDVLKELMMQCVTSRIELLKKFKIQPTQEDLHLDLLKHVYYIDLLDGDISQLFENIIIPICDEYSTQIISKVI